MKTSFSKFILVLVLALVGMNACYPGDYECADNAEVFSEVVKVVKDSNQDAPFGQSSQANSSENDTHYCLCSLTCHTMFLSCSSFKSLSYIVFNFSKEFQYTPHFYPQVIHLLEKPPAV